ncbi:hypothetical protein CDS [Bradyrhizobium sp.]|nr:hypothetical protein CDS [Bradyrhizobium sp.]
MLRQVKRVSKFWREYAGQLAVEEIDDKVMREFIPWRRDYYASFDKLPKNAKRHPTDKQEQRLVIGMIEVAYLPGGAENRSSPATP